MVGMASHLDTIVQHTRLEVHRRKSTASLALLERQAAEHTPRGFAAALQPGTGVAIIAELKKASPSKGLIRADFSAAALAPAMQAGGAAALSVLTDEPFFQGSLDNLRIASAATSIPCLRKDFIIDEYKILEARAHAADAVLLIAAALSDAELEQLTRAAHHHGLDILCEVHTREEAERIRHLGCDMIGVNNRDLHSFEVRLETSLELAAYLPTKALLVTESGIAQPADYTRLHAAGFRAFLIGETFMRQPEPGAALAAWMERARQHAASTMARV